MEDVSQGRNFLHLNRAGTWPDFQRRGLDLHADGSLRLSAVPGPQAPLPEGLEGLPALEGPAGLALSPGGSLYFSRPDQHQIWRIDECFADRHSLPCLGGAGPEPTRFHRPRGLLYHRLRDELFVADAGNDRLQIFAPEKWQLVDVWGPDLVSGEAERLDNPTSLAADDEGNVYAVDSGHRRILKFDLRGRLLPGFWATAGNEVEVELPVAVAALGAGREARVFVLDAGLQRVVVLDSEGHLRETLGEGRLEQPLALAAGTDPGGAHTLYVGDNGLRAVLVYREEGTYRYLGRAAGYSGPVSALLVDERELLWLQPGGEDPISLRLQGSYLKSGILWGGPFGRPDLPVSWRELRAGLSDLGQGNHVRLFFYGAERPDLPPPAPLADDPDPFRGAPWQPLALDAEGGLLYDTRTPLLWVGVHLTGEGAGSPHLSGLRVDFDHETYRQHLPAIYGDDPTQAGLLDRLLSLYESFYAEAEEEIDTLEHRFDPLAAPPEWLPWLAGWLSTNLDDNWSLEQTRQAIRDAWEASAERGTVGGLRKALRLYTGVDAHIEEPLAESAWWALAEGDAPEAERMTSSLGFGTRLAAGPADGAVLGSTALLDRSYIIGAQDLGAPLFDSLAHRVTIRVYRGQISGPADLERLEQIVQREKPAHVTHHVCLTEPRMRVGFQARLGIDTVVAGPSPPSRLGGAEGPAGLVLGGEPPGRMGERSKVGQTTRLTEGVPVGPEKTTLHYRRR